MLAYREPKVTKKIEKKPFKKFANSIYIYIAVETKNQLFMKNLLSTKHFVATLVVAFFTVINVYSQKTNDYIITKEKETIYLHGDKIESDEFSVQYTSENGKKASVKISKIFMLVVGNKVFLNLKGPLESVEAFSDKYILTYHSSSRSLYSVWDRDYNEVQKNINVNYSDEKREKILRESVFKYFKDCEDVQKLLLDNPTALNYFNCNNATDLVTGKEGKSSTIKEKKAEPESDKERNYGINQKGEKIVFLTIQYAANRQRMAYTTMGNAFPKSANMIDWKLLHLYLDNDDRIYQNFNLSDGKKVMLEVLVFSDKFILTRLMKPTKMGEYYIYNRERNMVENLFGEDKLVEMFNKYFKDYPKLIEIIQSNSQFHRDIVSGLSYVKCGESTPDLTVE
jgi:hypothetical protein